MARDIPEPWRLRLLAGGTVISGAAILIDRRHVLTCAHVVAVAAGDPAASLAPDCEIAVDFLAGGERRLSRLVRGGWFPADEGRADVAVLSLDNPAPESVQPARLGGEAPLGERVRAYGFPAGRDDGVWSRGRVVGAGGPGSEWIQIDGFGPTGQGVEPGFSGAGVVNEAGLVVGMIVTADQAPAKRIAWMLPMASIANYWPSLRSLFETEPSEPVDPAVVRAAEIHRVGGLFDELRTMADPVVRQRVVDSLRGDLAGAIPRHHMRRVDIDGIVTTAYDFEGGIYELVDVVRRFEGMSAGMRALDTAVATLVGFKGHRSGNTDKPQQKDVKSEPAKGSRPGAEMSTSTPMQALPDMRSAAPTVWGGVPPRNANFVGREELLRRMWQELHERDATVLVPHTRALQGMPGVGKTHLAIEYAYRYAADYELVWWVPAQEPWLVRRSLGALARRLGLQESIDIEQTVATVLDALRRGEPHRRWLMIFDNADRPEDLRRYLPQSGQVIVTSRNARWGGVARTVEVDVFRPEESISLLTGRGLDLTPEQALELAEELGHLPLAVDQAATWQAETGMPVTDYLRLLNDRLTQILGEGVDAEIASVTATYQIAFEGLRSRSPGAGDLLALCAFLSSQPIAIPMLLRGGKAALPAPLDETMRDDIPLRRAVREIGRSGLARIDFRRDSLHIHALVQAVLRDLIPPGRREEIEAAALRVLAWANPGAPDSPGNWPMYVQLGPHVRLPRVVSSADPDVRRSVIDQINYLFRYGDYAQSRELAEVTVRQWSSEFPPDDHRLLIARRHLGRAYRTLGDLDKARELNEETLERARRSLGEGHELTLVTTDAVSADVRVLGQFERAFELDEENLGRHRKHFGEDDPSTLATANNLALDLRLLGRNREALALDEDTVLRKTRLYGDEHPTTLFSYINLVRDLFGLGDYAVALDIQREKLRIQERVLPGDHGDVLMAKRNLAIILRKTGQLAEALETIEECAATYESRYGPAHQYTLGAATSRFNTLRALGECELALQIAKDTHAKYKGTFGDEHPFTLACAVNLAIVLRALDRHEEARAMDEAALTALVAGLGADHQYTLCCSANLANDYHAAGDYDAAFRKSEETVERFRRAGEESHPYTLGVEANFALDLQLATDQPDAAAKHSAAIDRIRHRLGSEHPEVINLERGRRFEAEIEPPPF